MSDQWDELPFGDLVEFRNGLNFSSSAYGAGTKFIGVADFKDYFVPKYETLSEVISEGLIKKSSLLENGDIVFVRSNGNKDLVGRSLFIRNLTEDVAYSGFCIRARPVSDKIDRLFLAYFCKSEAFRKRVANAAGGANIQSLSQPVLARCPIPVPQVSVQKRIVEVLSAYDDLIENNQRRIKLLEEMAQKTYEEWFVRFRFPGHETTPLDPKTGLPEGWKNTKLGEMCQICMGQSPKSEHYNFEGNGLPFHQGVKDYGERFPKNECWSTVGSRQADQGDVLFSVRAPVGRLNIALEKIILGRGLAAIRHKQNAQGFLYCLLKKQFFEEDMMGGGAIFNSVTKNDMHRIDVVAPTTDVLNRFSDLSDAIDREIELLHIGNVYLREARDILLPRLMMGMIDVDEYNPAEFLKEAA